MNDQDKTKEQLLAELETLRRRIGELEAGEEIVRESEERFRKIFEEGPLGVALVGLDGRIQRCNRRLCEMVGYSQPEIIALGLAGISHPDDWKRDFPFVSRLWRGEISSYDTEKRYLRRDGQVLWIHVTISLMRDDAGRPTNTIGMIEDIGERKRAEEALQRARDELEEKVQQRTAELAKANEELVVFRQFAEASGQGFGMGDLDAHITYVNPALCRLFGEDRPEDLVGKSFLTYYPESWKQRRSSEMIPAQESAGHWAGEQAILSRHGELIPALHDVFLLRDEQGTPVRRCVVITDISERKRAEQALVESEEKYRQLVETTDTGYLILDEEGRVIDANAEYVRLTGHKDLSDILGRRVTQWTAPHDAERNAREVAKCLQAGFVRHLEIDYSAAAGKIIPTEITASVVSTSQGRRIISLCRDITERRQAEEALRASEERFRSYFEQGLIGMAVYALDRRWREVNDRLCSILGYCREELSHMTWMEVTHPDDVEPNLALSRRLFAGEIDHYSMEKRFIRKDGSLVYANLFSRCFHRKDGSLDHVIALIEDVTQRKQAAEALRQNHDQLQTIYDGIVEGLLITDIETRRFVRANAVMCRMLGYREEELLAASIEDIHPPEEVPEDLQRFQAAAEGRVSLNEDRPVLCKDGSVFYADISGHPIHYNGRRCVLALFRDISERKRAEAALRQSHDELRAIYDQVADGIVILGLEDNRPLRANAAFCRMLGYSDEEMRSLSPQEVHPPHVMPEIWQHLQAVTQHGVAQSQNMPFVRKDGSVFYADVVSSRILYNGRICRISFLHDVTPHKQAQEALQREHRTLKHMLQSSDHERQLIAYEIHDGLAQQLAAAIMQFDTFAHLKDTKPNLAAKAYEGGMTMLKQGHFEARRLISGVRPPVLDESGVVEAIAHLIHEVSRRKGPKIEYRSKVQFDRLVPILENAIYRIVQEGLTNACKHSQSEKVRISLLQPGKHVRIEIRDWGVGFEPNGVQKNRFGLAGIRQRARLLGGKCRIRSQPDQGTLVVVELPVVVNDEES